MRQYWTPNWTPWTGGDRSTSDKPNSSPIPHRPACAAEAHRLVERRARQNRPDPSCGRSAAVGAARTHGSNNCATCPAFADPSATSNRHAIGDVGGRYELPVAPLDQEALTRWLEKKVSKMRGSNHAETAGEVHAYGIFVARMKRGNLPEIDDVDAVVAEFSPPPRLQGLGGTR